MSSNSNRSEQVVERYKRHKLAASALHEIHRLLREFEQVRADDKRIAVIGMVALMGLIAVAWFFIAGGETITIS